MTNTCKNASGKKALMIIACRNFRDEEYFEPKEILIGAGVGVSTASSSLGRASGMLGGSVKPDKLISEISVDDFDAVLFIGGGGSSEYWDNPDALAIAKDAFLKNKVVGAICIAPVTLANAGILKGKKATVFPSEKAALACRGAEYTGRDVEEDGNIVTAYGPKAAGLFGRTILKKLSDK